MNKVLRYILYGAGTVVVIGGLLYIFVFYKGTIAVNPEPSNATTTIDNKTLTGAAKFRLKPGNYTVKVEAEGFVPYLKEIKAESSKTINLDIKLIKIPTPEKIYTQSAAFLSEGKDNSLFYLANGGKTLYMMTNPEATEEANRKIVPITPDVFTNLTDVIWSPDKELSVMKRGGETFLYDFKRYDLLHQELHPWQESVGDVVWSPDAKYVAYFYNPEGGEKTIIRADRANIVQERIYNLKDTAINNPQLDWSPDGKKIILVTNDIYILDVYSKDIKKITEKEEVLGAKFTSDSKYIVYGKKDGLYLTNLDGTTKRNLDIQSVIEKIVFIKNSNKFIAVTTDAAGTEKLVKVNYETAEKTDLFYQSTAPIKFNNITILNDDKILYFLSGSNIYRLNLVGSEY